MQSGQRPSLRRLVRIGTQMQFQKQARFQCRCFVSSETSVDNEEAPPTPPTGTGTATDESVQSEAESVDPRFLYWTKKRQSVQRGQSFHDKNDLAFEKEGVLELPHFVFAGRTNVGKSSLINNLLGRKNIARASSVAGKTVSVNTYVVNHKFALADLPGYGESVPGKTATLDVDRKWVRVWRPLVSKFIRECGSRPTPVPQIGVEGELPRLPSGIHGMFFLCDIKSKTTPEDKAFLEMFRKAAPTVPIVLVLTKDDRVKNSWRR